MKKIILLYVLIAMFMILFSTGCLKNSTQNTISVNFDKKLLEVVENGNTLELHTATDVSVLGFEISGELENSISLSNDLISLVKNKNGKTYCAFSGKNRKITKGTTLFNINKLNLNITNSESLNLSTPRSLTSRNPNEFNLIDFNCDGFIDRLDLDSFANHYPSEIGAPDYNERFDIGPATDTTGDNLYDMKHADGKINLLDFHTFAWNYSPSSSKQSINVTFPNSSSYQEGPYTVLPDTFNLKIVAMYPESELVELDVKLLCASQTLFNETKTSGGTHAFIFEKLTIDTALGEENQKELTLQIRARNKNGTIINKDLSLLARKREGIQILSVSGIRYNEPSLLKPPHYTIPSATLEDIVEKPESEKIVLPFGISRITFDLQSEDIQSGDSVKVYVYHDPVDIFCGEEYAFKAEAIVNEEKRVMIELANFWRSGDEEDSIWLALQIHKDGNNTASLKYLWNISPNLDDENPMLNINSDKHEFYEGEPLYFEINAKDELLTAITDIEIQTNVDQTEWKSLEEVVNNMNDALLPDEVYQFALRYHVKIQPDLTETTYASGLVDDGIDYIVSNAVTSHGNIKWFDIFHGIIPGMPEDPLTQADYWWKTDGFLNIIGEDDDDSYYGENTPDEEPYATNLPSYKELDHRAIDNRQYVYEFTDLDTTRAYKIKKEAFVENIKFKIWIYPEIVRADKNDILSNIEKPEVFDVVDTALAPGTCRNHYIDYRLKVEVTDWRYGLYNPDNGKTEIYKTFSVEEDEVSPTVEISGYTASEEAEPFTHLFKDHYMLYTLSSDNNPSLANLFIDEVEVFTGGEITIRAKDDIALNDFLIYFDSVESDDSNETNTPQSPVIQRTDYFSHPLTGFDYKFNPEFTVFKLIEGEEETGNATISLLRTFDSDFTEKRLRLFGEDFTVNNNIISPILPLDETYEYYVNFTNDDITSEEEMNAHQNTFGRYSDIYLADSQDPIYELYGGEYASAFKGYDETENLTNRNKAEYTLQIPDQPGVYYVWIVARDRSTQDTSIFDYPFNEQQDYFGEDIISGNPPVQKRAQNEIFGNLIDNNGNPNLDIVYYDNSRSEDDADMVVLLKMNVQRRTNSAGFSCTFPETYCYGEDAYAVVPGKFNLIIWALSDLNNLVELHSILQSGTQTLMDHTELSNGTNVLTIRENDITPEFTNNNEATMTLHLTAKCNDGTVITQDSLIKSKKRGIAIIDTIEHIKEPENLYPAAHAHYTFPVTTLENIEPLDTSKRISILSGITKMRLWFVDMEIKENDVINAYIYSNTMDINTENPDNLKCTTIIDSENHCNLELCNLWQQDEANEGKWLVVSVYPENSSTSTIKYIWNIEPVQDIYAPELSILESSADVTEGVPLYCKVSATDELLEAITDLGVQVNIGQSGWEPLEEKINQLNASVPPDAYYNFAVRYHVKIQMDLTETTYASGLVDDGIDYLVSNAVVDHENIRWFDVFHGTIPGMPENPQTQATYWWKSDGLATIAGEDDDDSYYEGKTPDEEPYTSNIPNYRELNNRELDKRQYVYEFTDLDESELYSIPKEAFVEAATFKIWLYPEVVRASKADILSGEIKPEVYDIADVYIKPGTWLDQSVDYKIVMEVADWRWSGQNPDMGKTKAEANFIIEEDEISPTIEISGFDASQQNQPFKHVFRDNDDWFTLAHNIHYPAGMFFIDKIECFSGGEITIRAGDDIALNDFLIYFDSEELSGSNETTEPHAPFILRNSNYSHPLAGFDYKFNPDFIVFKLVEGEEHEGNATPVLLSDFDSHFTEKSLRILGEDFKINGNQINSTLQLDDDYEYYVNFTNDDIVTQEEIAAHANTSGNENDVYPGISANTTYEPYSGEYTTCFRGYDFNSYSSNNERAEFTFHIPDVEGEYYVWIVARDRSTQDTVLFDYPANPDEDYFSEHSLGEFEPVVLKGYQNEIFGDVINDNGYPNYDIEYYDSSMSEDDADMVVLLRISVKPHSWDIMRLDIHDASLEASLTTDNSGFPIWYAHSYHPWQVPEEFNNSDLKVDERRLPRAMYPVYKYYEMYKEGNREIYPMGRIDPFGYRDEPYNVHNAVEPNAGTNDLHEYVPIIGGENSTTFRIRTHEDITKVNLYLVEGEHWYISDVEQHHGNLDISPTVIASVTMVADDTDKQSGFWEWEIDDWSDVNGHNLMDVEATFTVAARVSSHYDPRFLFEQFQWPVFLKTTDPSHNLPPNAIDNTGEATKSHTWAFTVDTQ